MLVITGTTPDLVAMFVVAVLDATDDADEDARGSFLVELAVEDAAPLPLFESDSVAGRARFVHTVFPYTRSAAQIKAPAEK